MQDEAEQKAKIDREQANELEYVDESQKSDTTECANSSNGSAHRSAARQTGTPAKVASEQSCRQERRFSNELKYPFSQTKSEIFNHGQDSDPGFNVGNQS